MAYTPKDSRYDDAFIYQNPTNGIGNFFGNMDRWRDMSTGFKLNPEQVQGIQANNKNGVDLSRAWMDNGNLHGAENQKLYDAMKGYTYKGGDGKNYMISGNYYHGGGGDQEGANTAGDLAFGGIGALGHPELGRKPGEMAYSTTEFRPGWGGDIGDYNGKNFDFYDSKGKYVGGQTPTMMGDDQMGTTAALLALMVASGGLAGAAMAPAAAAGAGGAAAGAGAAGAAAGAGTTFGVVDASLIGAGMEGLGAAGAAGAGAGAGAGALDLGGGLSMGADGAIGGSSGLGVGGSSISNAGILEGVGAGGIGAGSSGGGMTGMLNKPLFEIPGIGGVSGQNLLGLGSTLMGGLSGGQGQSATQTTTRDLPEYLQGPVGGLVGQANSLMGQQMGGGGLLDTPSKKKKKQKRGLL